MPRKIYDIKPPIIVNKLEKVSKEILVSSKGKSRRAKNKKEPRSIWWPISISIFIIFVLVGVYLFFKLPKAEILIWPKVDTLSFKETLIADKSVGLADIAKNIIPAQYFESIKSNSQDFPATGNASDEGRASGTITIYNKYDPPTPLTFRAGTHFMSDSGKLFVAANKIYIPAATKSGGKITPGSVQVQVQAVEGGSDYNIAPANFSVPGLKGTAYYYSIYATSAQAMAGGYAGKVKKVTDDDIQEAKRVLSQKTIDDAISSVKSQISSDYILLDNAVLSNVTSASTQIKAGTIADNFNYQATVKASALAFKKSDLEQFVKNYVLSQMPEGKTLLDSSSNIDYSSNVVDISGGKATINLDFSSAIYQNINKNSVALSLLGQNTEQIKTTIKNSLGEEVSKVQVNFWPFWVTSAPNRQKAVNIRLKFE